MVEIIGQGMVTLHWQPDALTFSDEQHATVNAIWEQRPPHLFNGSLLVHLQTLVETNHIRLVGTFTEYKFYFAQRQGFNLGLATIGVSGLIVLENQVVIARRSAHMTGYPNMLELVPSGTIDKGVAQENGLIDYATKIKQEFSEEVGLPESHVLNVNSFGVTYDATDMAYDILCRLDVDTTSQIILARLAQSEEYTEPMLVPLEGIEDWLQVRKAEILPTVIPILAIYRTLLK